MSRKLVRLICVLHLGLALAACGSSGPKPGQQAYPVEPGRVHEQENSYIEFVGKVVYIQAEGGFYGLQVGKNRYDPLQLPKNFEVDGKQVYVRAHVRDWVSGRNWGRMVQVVDIQDCCTVPEPADEDD